MNRTVEILNILINQLKNVDLSEFAILSESKNMLLSSITSIPNGLDELSISLNSLLYSLKSSYVDLTNKITECQNKTNSLLAIVSTNLLRSLNTIKLSIPSSFNSTYTSFVIIENSIQQLSSFLYTTQNLLFRIIKINKSILFYRVTKCNISPTNLKSQLMMMPDIFRAYSQINIYIEYYQSLLFQDLIIYNFKVFSFNNFSTSISPDINASTEFVNLLDFSLKNLTTPINFMYNLNNETNAIVLSELLANISLSLNLSINSIRYNKELLLNLNFSEYIASQQNLNSIIDIINASLEFTILINNTFNNTDTSARPVISMPFTTTSQSIEAANFQIFSNSINTVFATFQRLNSNFQRFYVSILNYKRILGAYNNVNSSQNSLMNEIAISSSSIENLIIALNYVVCSTSNMSVNDSKNLLSASESLSKVQMYLVQLNNKLSNFTLLTNDTSQVNSTIEFTLEFLNFSQTLFPDINKFAFSYYGNLNSNLLYIKTDLNSYLNMLYQALIYVFETTTTSATTTSIKTSTTTTLVLNWNEWKPWCFCLFYRRRRNSATNEINERVENISCTLLGKSFFNFLIF